MSDNEKKCPQCGAPAEEGAAFCTSCGAKLEAEAAPVSETVNTAEPIQEEAPSIQPAEPQPEVQPAQEAAPEPEPAPQPAPENPPVVQPAPANEQHTENTQHTESTSQSSAEYANATVVSPKSKVAAGLLGIFLGGLGIHKFYLGYTKEGIIMLLISLIAGCITCGVASAVVGIIGLIEGILYLTKSDEDFQRIYVEGHKGWF